jgi:hypothetical protein
MKRALRHTPLRTPWIGALAAVPCLLAPGLPAWQKGSEAPPSQRAAARFDPERQLEGWVDVQISEYRSLYRLAEFEQQTGKFLSQEQVDQLRQAWRVERQRVAGEIETLLRDPRARALFRIDRDVKAHPTISRLRTQTFETHDPFVFVIQEPRTLRATYEEEVVEAYGPDLLGVRALFRDELGKPLQLAERADSGAYPIIVLAGADEYARYLRTLEGPALFFSQAHYDRKLRAVVTFLEPDAKPGSEPALRRPVVHEAVLALLDGHAQAQDREREPWIDEGLASWLSTRVLAPGEHHERPPDSLVLQALVQVAGDVDLRTTYLLALEELTGMRTYAKVFERVRQQAVDAQVALPDYPTALLALYAQAGAWVWFLNEGQGGAHRAGFGAYLVQSLADKGGPEALRRAFQGTTTKELDAAFREYVASSVEGWRKEFEQSHGDLEATFRLSTVTESTLRQEAEERTRMVEALAPARDDPEVRFALVLRAATDGRFDEAAQELQVVASEHGAGPLAERFALEVERLNAFRAERVAFLRALQESGQKLNLDMPDGRRLLSVVTAVEDERVVLGPNKLGLEELALDEIDPLQLVKLMRTSRYGFPRSWIQVYPHVLLASETRDRMLADETSEGARALAAEVEGGGYARWLGLAEAVGLLSELSAAGIPEKEEAARTAVEKVSRLIGEHGELELVKARHAALTQLAHRAWTILFERDGLPDVLHAKVEELGEGRWRLTYPFDDPAEASDFTATPYLNEQRWKGSPTAQSSTPFHVADGVLAGKGALCVRHVLEFEGPQTVRMRYVFKTPEGVFDNRIRSMIGLCDDKAGSYVTVDMLGGISVMDRARAYQQQAESASQIFMDTEHALEIVHDGAERVRTSFDAQPAAEVDCGPRLVGSLFLWLNSDSPFEVLELSIEARVAPASLRTLRLEWVQARVKAMGL